MLSRPVSERLELCWSAPALPLGRSERTALVRSLEAGRAGRTSCPLPSARTGAETPPCPRVRTTRHAHEPWPRTGPKRRTDTSWRRRWTTRPPPRSTTSPRPWWSKCRRRNPTYPREKRGLGNLTFFSHALDTPLDWEMSGDFLIYVEKTEEVKRIFFLVGGGVGGQLCAFYTPKGLHRSRQQKPAFFSLGFFEPRQI